MKMSKAMTTSATPRQLIKSRSVWWVNQVMPLEAASSPAMKVMATTPRASTNTALRMISMHGLLNG